MNRDLDEIEAELGKERTLKVGDRVRTYYTRKEGVIVGPCPRHSGNWHVDVGDGTCNVKCAAECNLTPVEPERVKWYYRMSCATRSCAANDEGMCNVSINGLATCSKHQWPKPSPGLLQRMGMCVWGAKDWYVVGKARNDGHPIISSRFMTEDEATSLALGWQGIALRWSQGVQG